MGTYGFLRFSVPLFPAATIACIPWLSALAVIGIVYGALVSMVQTDIKKLVAYSSVSHLGFVVLGIFAMTEESVQGGILQMVNHGLSTGALFLLVGMMYDRRHTREIAEFGGIARVMPVFAVFFMVVSLSSIGLPGLNGFVGEFLILIGAYSSPFLSGWFAIVASTGVIFAAVYLLWMYQRVFLGENLNPKNSSLKDLTSREVFVLVPVVLLHRLDRRVPRDVPEDLGAKHEGTRQHLPARDLWCQRRNGPAPPGGPAPRALNRSASGSGWRGHRSASKHAAPHRGSPIVSGRENS